MLHNLLKAFDNLQFDWEVVKKTLDVTWKGLLAIFVTIFIIVIVVKLTAYCIDRSTKFFENRKAQKEAKKLEAEANAKDSGN